MTARAIDLHVHSNKSDGTFSPTRLLDYAMEKGLAAIALTDHDTVDGLDEIIEYATILRCRQSSSDPASPAYVPEIIPGIEFSTEYEGRDIHILGLYIDYCSPAFK